MLAVNIKNVRTVRQLKEAIAARHDLSVTDVLYRGLDVRNDRQLAHLLPTMMKIGKSPRFSVRIRLATKPRSPGSVSLSLRCLAAKTIEVHLPAHSTVGDAKDAVQDIEGIPVDQIRLMFHGKQLVDNTSPLATHNLVSGSVVHLVLRLRGGGGGPSQPFVDMENMSSLKTCKVDDPDKYTKPWKLVSHGLNIRGVCRNVECKAHGCNVWCSKGFTVFNLAEPVNCPSCKKNFTAITCGFGAASGCSRVARACRPLT